MKALHTPFILLLTTSVYAVNFPIPERFDQDILADDSPTAWTQNKLGIDDFQTEWIGATIPGVTFSLGKKSYDVARAIDILVLPRARLKISVDNIQSGSACNAAGCQPFTRDEAGQWNVDLPIPLMSGASYATKVTVTRNNKSESGLIGVVFKPRTLTLEQLVSTDPTCSPYELRLKSVKPGTTPLWVTMGCRLIYSEGDEHRTSSLVIYTYWENKKDSGVMIDGALVPPLKPKIYVLDLRSSPGTFTLSDGEHEVEMSYSVPNHLRFGRFLAGLGPYWLNFSGNGESSSTPSAMATFYGSYFLTNNTRITSFASFMPDSHLNATWGLYFRNLSFSFLDKRIVVYLNFGGHFQGFSALGQYNVLFTLPQGSEIRLIDFLKKEHDLYIGAFLQPSINSIGYTEFWVRYGNYRWFGEMNYTYRFQPVNGINFSAQTFGVSLGHYFGGIL